MATFDFMVQEHVTTLEFVWTGMHYVSECSCGWTSPIGQKYLAEEWAAAHVAEREKAVEAAKEKTRYLIREEP